MINFHSHPLESSDQQLEQQVAALLSSRNIPALRSLSVIARGGMVTLLGRVNSFYERQLAHNCCRQLAGVKHLVDQIEVRHQDAPVSRRTPRGWHLHLAR